SISDTTIQLLLGGGVDQRWLLPILVLARAIDLNVKTATKVFGERRTVELAGYFCACCRHFEGLLRELKVSQELPEDADQAWLLLHSQTIIGNSLLEAEQFYPLMDRYMSELTLYINRELEELPNTVQLPRLPLGRNCRQRKSIWDLSGWRPLPKEIERAWASRNFTEAMVASLAYFRSHANDGVQVRVGKLFCIEGLHRNRTCAADPLNQNLVNEGIRLLTRACASARGKQRTSVAVWLLRFLLEPDRPKALADNDLARRMFCMVSTAYRERGMDGMVAYLKGGILWLEGDERSALNCFWEAKNFGKGSCGSDWISLLRRASVLGGKISLRRRDQFLKLAKLEGIFSDKVHSRMNQRSGLVTYAEFSETFWKTFYPFSELKQTSRPAN
ncbi:MAG TPA: hypothetical protein VMF06_22350, partial [Candidatus Limnocylindria bacterium]|nr:hypothetical protein [Candidatus Limnocylindria bacterium]